MEVMASMLANLTKEATNYIFIQGSFFFYVVIDFLFKG